MLLTCFKHVGTLVDMNEQVELLPNELDTIVMDRFTQFKANFPAIQEPRWSDGTLLIRANVAEHNKVACIYTRPNGTRMFPEPLYVSGRTAKKYKPFNMATRGGGVVRMRAVPISEFKVLHVSDRSLYA